MKVTATPGSHKEAKRYFPQLLESKYSGVKFLALGHMLDQIPINMTGQAIDPEQTMFGVWFDPRGPRYVDCVSFNADSMSYFDGALTLENER